MNQFNALIVDDEIHSIRGVQAGVNWEKENINVFTALNVKQAQEVFRNNRIDFLLCDIEMPKGSGIDLLRWVRENYEETEAVFLTCHSDFSYAKEAIKLQSLNYLLKPVDYGELEEVIYEALEKIKKDNEKKRLEKSYQSLRKTHEELMQERFWMELISGAIPDEQIKSNMNYYHLSYHDNTTFLPILIHVQDWINAVLSSEEEKIMDYALQKAVIEMIASNKDDPVINVEKGFVLVLLPTPLSLNKKELLNLCEQFISEFSQYFSCVLCCYFGFQVTIHEITNMVRKMLELDRNNVTMRNKVIQYKESRTEETTYPPFQSRKWTNIMRAGEKEKLLEEISTYFIEWEKSGEKITAQTLHLFYQDFLQFIFFNLHVKGINANEVYSQNLLTEKPNKVLQSLHSLQDWLVYVTEVALNKIHPPEEKESVVEVVKQYITENIGERKLTRESIASHVFLNPDYLSRLFKKQTGLSISAYLQVHRIEYAKKLLVETDLPISDIALSSGYANFSHFSTIFKKAMNVSPAEFRKKFS